MVFAIVAGVVLALIILLVISGIRVIRQAEAAVVERFGAYSRTLDVGIHIVIPFIDVVARRVSLKESLIDFAPQPVITKDNVTMMIDSVLYFQITDPKLYAYGVANPIGAIENLTATTLRNLIGQLELDETLTSRDLINTRMREILDEATDPWGIKVNRVEVKNIQPPRDIQDAMEKQMRAEREKRESILKAEGEKQAAILVAEGEKEAAILRAEAKKQTEIKLAEGKAFAIKAMQEAEAAGIQMIKDAGADPNVIALKGFEALVKMADSPSTKLIIPSELQGVAGLASSVKELIK
ncbi:MAG: SPFH domain-containing protein [Spirochaetia bacterium]|nr:SPFH domain-containing protein [Spirochaetia bacterium]